MEVYIILPAVPGLIHVREPWIKGKDSCLSPSDIFKSLVEVNQAILALYITGIPNKLAISLMISITNIIMLE